MNNLKIFAVVIALVGLVFFIDMNINEKKYDEKYDFKLTNIVNEKVKLTILFTEKYRAGRGGSSYYVYTDQGRLILDAENEKYDFFSADRDMYNELTELVNNTCLFSVRKRINNTWETFDFKSCITKGDS